MPLDTSVESALSQKRRHLTSSPGKGKHKRRGTSTWLHLQCTFNLALIPVWYPSIKLSRQPISGCFRCCKKVNITEVERAKHGKVWGRLRSSNFVCRVAQYSNHNAKRCMGVGAIFANSELESQPKHSHRRDGEKSFVPPLSAKASLRQSSPGSSYLALIRLRQFYEFSWLA